MYPKSKQRFTLKIITGYLVLGMLALLAALFIYHEFRDYNASQNQKGNNITLLKINSLLTKLYEAENLSKMALQSKRKGNLRAYAKKVDSIFNTIDSLKRLVPDSGQVLKLDSVQQLLHQKVYNNAELLKLKVRNIKSAPIDSLLKKFNEMEVDLGRITPKTFVSNFEQLPWETQELVREYVAILNKNIPEYTEKKPDKTTIDSILQISKAILEQAKNENERIERSVIKKELEIYKVDLELSQKLRSMISAFEQEIIRNAFLDNLNKERALKRSIRLTGAAIILGFLVVAIFTFLITKDFWKVQRYREKLEKEKKYSESLLKSREQLISTVSHDLKTPLNTINGYAELMQHSDLRAKQLEYLKHIESASKYVDNLVNDLLDFSKLEAGKIQIEKVPFVLSRLIKETALDFKEIGHKTSVELQLDIAEELKLPIMGDPFRLRQILANLLGNAFKFTHSGYVKVKAFIKRTDDGPCINIMVIDTGIGIPKEKQKLIFKEFTQAERSIEEHYGGYGLGLTISKKLVQLLNGNLYLESEENQGSTFTLALPLLFSKTDVVSDKTLPVGLKKLPTLLIFDDDQALLELLREMCEIHSIPVKTYSNFLDFSEEDAFAYGIVITDIQMPKIDGFEVIKRLKRRGNDRYKGQPIIAMTGQRKINRKLYTNAGFAHVLQKPFSQIDLLEALAKFSNSYVMGAAKNPVVPDPKSKMFNTGTITAFLNDPQGIHDVLESFLKNTKENMVLLSSAVENKNYDSIRNLSHKMLPMFRQLKVNDAIPILERFEQIPEPCESLFEKFNRLKDVTSNLEKAVHTFLVTLPIDID